MMDTIISFLRISFRMNVKRTLAYPSSFWFGFLTIPFYSLVQIIFVEGIYGQTSSFLGYSKYDMYIIFGTFRLVQGIGFLLFYQRLAELKFLIRGEGEESLDAVLVKPIDPQLYTTVGKYGLGNISSIVVGIAIVIYGVLHATLSLSLVHIVGFLLLASMGVLFMYVTFLLLNTLLFWFDLHYALEGLWDAYQSFGHYPPTLYHGAVSLIFTIVLPVTLMAGTPTGFLLGKISPLNITLSGAVMIILFYLSRLFWQISIKKYSSFSS